MLELVLDAGRPLTVLALGAHCDDVEIAAGGTLLRLAAEAAEVRAHVVVLSSTPDRARETEASVAAFLSGAATTTEIHDLPDGHVPAHWQRVKDIVDDLARTTSPDVILAPTVHDAHQDHALLGSLVTTAFRDHLVLRYEIPKWDGDLGAARPTHYVTLSEATARRKCALLAEHYPSQHGRDWWNEATFLALMRLRGVESRAAYAEAFAVDKALLSFAGGQ